MNADDGVRVIRRAGEHALQLGLSDTRLDGRNHFLDVVDRRLVTLGGSELEVLERVVHIAREALHELDFFLRRSSLAHQGLGLLLFVPEFGLGGELVQLFDFSLQLSEVKETPLAHQRAF
jgi:hypothetical protein